MFIDFWILRIIYMFMLILGGFENYICVFIDLGTYIGVFIYVNAKKWVNDKSIPLMLFPPSVSYST